MSHRSCLLLLAALPLVAVLARGLVADAARKPNPHAAPTVDSSSPGHNFVAQAIGAMGVEDLQTANACP